MRVLRAVASFVEIRLLRHIDLTEAVIDECARRLLRFGSDAHRVGADIGDQTDRALAANIDALVELLGDHHRALGGKS